MGSTTAPAAEDPAADVALHLAEGGRDLLLPMHLRLSGDGRVLHAGPTLRKVVPALGDGTHLFDHFRIRRPAGCTALAALVARGPCRLQVDLCAPPHTSFKGIAVPSVGGDEVLVNLSFGISIVDAIRDFDLTSTDFAHTDLAIEMLYLVEAKTAILEEWRSLNTRLSAAKMAAEQQAYTDTLTGLHNRRAMDHVLAELCSHRSPFGLIHLDLDFFKQVNDTFGHAAGDRVLQVAADKIRRGTRAGDTLIRAGGDEFVLILPDLVDVEALADLSRRLIADLEVPIPYGEDICRISGSAGIAVTTGRPPMSPDTLLDRADRALYASKNGGRGRATVFTSDLPT